MSSQKLFAVRCFFSFFFLFNFQPFHVITVTVQTGLLTTVFALGDVIFFMSKLPPSSMVTFWMSFQSSTCMFPSLAYHPSFLIYLSQLCSIRHCKLCLSCTYRVWFNRFVGRNFIWDLALSKLYSNCLLSTLNARASLQFSSRSTGDCHSAPRHNPVGVSSRRNGGSFSMEAMSSVRGSSYIPSRSAGITLFRTSSGRMTSRLVNRLTNIQTWNMGLQSQRFVANLGAACFNSYFRLGFRNKRRWYPKSVEPYAIDQNMCCVEPQ